MSIVISDEVIERAAVREEEMRLEIAVLLFEKELFTLGQASEFAQLSQYSFMQELGKRDISIHYDVADYKEDLKNLGIVN